MATSSPDNYLATMHIETRLYTNQWFRCGDSIANASGQSSAILRQCPLAEEMVMRQDVEDKIDQNPFPFTFL